MPNENCNENTGHYKKIAREEFWDNAQVYGRKVGCKISDKPLSWWHNIIIYSDSNMLDKYINIFMELEDYNSSSGIRKYNNVHGMKAISAIQKANVDGRSMLIGVLLAIIGVIVSILPILINPNNIAIERFGALVVVVSFLWIYSSYQQMKASIKNSAINDAIESFKQQ